MAVVVAGDEVLLESTTGTSMNESIEAMLLVSSLLLLLPSDRENGMSKTSLQMNFSASS